MTGGIAPGGSNVWWPACLCASVLIAGGAHDVTTMRRATAS